MVTISIELLVAVGSGILSLFGYSIWASLRIGKINSQIETNRGELDRLENKVDKLSADLSNNYVHNRVMDEIKQQLNDIKDAINNLKN